MSPHFLDAAPNTHMIPPTTHEDELVTPENIDRLLREAWDMDKIIEDAVEGMARQIGSMSDQDMIDYIERANNAPRSHGPIK